LPAASIACRNSSGATNLVMIGGVYGTSLIYDVSDPVHPRLQCRIAGTSALLFGGSTFTYLDPQSADLTNIRVHSFANGSDTPAGTLPVWTNKATWHPSGGLVAYSTRLEATGASETTVQVWLFGRSAGIPLFTYRMGAVDCICRFGLPQPVLAASPDGQYLVAGWGFGKGGDPLAVFRLSDRTRVATLDQATTAFWDRTGHRLYLVGYGTDTAKIWTPESGISSLAGAGAWTNLAGLSPDGGQVAYTANADPSSIKLRVYVYDTKAGTTRMLVDKLRTQALFVRSDWVWYLEEVACDPVACGAPWGTQPTGKVFAMQLSTGTESEVSFGVGENPVMATDQVNWLPFTPGEFWPAT
jgi:WD40 repeat protein